MINKIWNGRLAGIISALILFVYILFKKSNELISSYLFRNNINYCGKDVHVLIGSRYRYPKFIKVGNSVIIGKYTYLTSEDIHTKFLLIEDKVSIGSNCTIDFSGGLTIRYGAHIAHDVLVSSHDHGYDYRNQPVGKSLEIGEFSFIGSKSIIMHNCNYIGKNAVIGSGSVVTKDVPDNAIVVGNPAKIIKFIHSIPEKSI